MHRSVKTDMKHVVLLPAPVRHNDVIVRVKKENRRRNNVIVKGIDYGNIHSIQRIQILAHGDHAEAGDAIRLVLLDMGIQKAIRFNRMRLEQIA